MSPSSLDPWQAILQPAAPVAVWNALLEQAAAHPGFLEGQYPQFRKPPSKIDLWDAVEWHNDMICRMKSWIKDGWGEIFWVNEKEISLTSQSTEICREILYPNI